VETFGDHAENGINDVHWLKVMVDARSREVFSYQPQIVPGNRTAFPRPRAGSFQKHSDLNGGKTLSSQLRFPSVMTWDISSSFAFPQPSLTFTV